ncbi:MAG: zinc-ribbon domain-containing protein [Lutibacter sp.]|nr:zinc-ribbon domain-containing protein [Lutibacter sp.]MDP3358626.1 zinc-ribbon domain-containing protein [Lutibacter sp.]
MSKHCSNCGVEIIEGASFCSKCGAPIENISIQNDKDDDILIEESLNQPNKELRISKILVGVLVLTVLFFIGKSFLFDFEPIEKSFSITEQLSKLEGKWHDPAAILLGDKDAIIILKRKGEIITGKDKKGLYKFKITPFGSNNYQAIVMAQNRESDFSVHFYEEENKLVFFSTLTKSSWYLKKIKY